MDQFDYLTRDQLISLVRKLGPARGDDRDGLPEFNERARREFDDSPSPMRVFDIKTLKYLAVNDAAVVFYGYSREEFLALSLKDTRHPDEHAAQLGSLTQAAGHFRYGAPRRHIKKSGEVAVVELVTQDVVYEGRAARLALTLDISGRLRIQEQLWQRQQEFDSLMTHTPDIVARLDRDFRHLYVTPSIAAATGRPPEAFIGKTIAEVGMPPDLVARWDAVLKEVFATGAERSLESFFAGPDGTRYYESLIVPERYAGGSVVTALTITRDITERVRTEVELRRQKQILDAVVDNLPVGVFIRDANHRFLKRNRFSQNRFRQGGPAKDAGSDVGKTAHDLFPREQADLFVESDRRLFETGRMEDIPEQQVSDIETGAVRIQHTRKVPLYDENGRPWLIVGVTDDITERRKEQEQQRRLAAIVDNSVDAVVSTDLDGAIRTWNPAAERLFGYRADEVIGQNVRVLIPAERQDEETVILDRIQSGMQVENYETVRCRKDGTPVDVSLSISPIRDAAGRLVGASAIARDITERRQAELDLLRNAAMARLLASLARAASDAASPEEAMKACLERICRHGRWVLGRVEVFDRGQPRRLPGHSIWYAPERERFGEFIGITEGHVHSESGVFIGRVLRERTAMWVEDWRRLAGYRRWEAGMAQGLRSAFAFPIIARGEIVAIMEVFGEEVRPQDPHLMNAAQSLASQLARIVEREWAHQADARMAAIVESSQDAVMSRGLDGTILTWNPAAERLFGYSAAEIVGQKIEILYPPEIKEDMRRRQDLLLQGVSIQAYESVRCARDGSLVHVSTSPAPIRDSSGKICGVSTIMRDITASRLAERALRQAQQHLQIAVRGANVGVWDWDVKGGAIYFSPEWKQQLGYGDSEIANRFEEWQSRVHRDDLEHVQGTVREFLARPGPDYRAEYRLRHKDGSYRWILSRAAAYVGAGGSVERMFGCHVDVTEQKNAEVERLDQAVRQRDALVREVHHRIKNNLQGVVGLLRQKIRKHPAVAPSIEEAIVQLQTVAVVYGLQGTRADGLLSLAEMVEAICASAEGLIGGHVDRVFLRETARPACVAGSEAVSVAVALNELVFNALKHQASAAGKKRVQVNVAEAADATEISIVNRGRLPRGFDFAAGRALGNGLGLVRTLLGSPGGVIDFAAARGKVEVKLKLSPPLLAARQNRVERSESDGASHEKDAATPAGR